MLLLVVTLAPAAHGVIGPGIASATVRRPTCERGYFVVRLVNPTSHTLEFIVILERSERATRYRPVLVAPGSTRVLHQRAPAPGGMVVVAAWGAHFLDQARAPDLRECHR